MTGYSASTRHSPCGRCVVDVVPISPTAPRLASIYVMTAAAKLVEAGFGSDPLGKGLERGLSSPTANRRSLMLRDSR